LHPGYGDVCMSGRQLQHMRVVAYQKRMQQLRIVGSYRRAHARPLRQRLSPCADLRRVSEYREIGELIEHVEIAEDRCEHRVHQAEALSRKKSTRAQRLLDARKLRGDRLTFALKYRGIAGRLQAPYFAENGGAKL